MRRGEDAYVMRTNVPKVPEDVSYTGLFAYGRKDCGADFLDKIMDGTVELFIFDQNEGYDMEFHYMGQEATHSNIVWQYKHNVCDGNCLGNAKKDTFEYIVTGLSQVNFGNKDMETCLLSLKNGVLGGRNAPEVTDEDVTPCVSWTNKYW